MSGRCSLPGSPSRAPLAVALLGVALALACGSGQVAEQAPRVPDARKAALGKMVRAVEQSHTGTPSDAALELLTHALEEDPDLWEARYDLGVLLARRGDLKRARQELERAHALAPNAEDVVVALGEVLRRSDDHAEAARVLTQFVARFAGAARARRVLVMVLRESRQLDQALIQARASLAQSPGDPAALAELALTHLELGQVEVAELLIVRALESGPRAAVVERAAGLIALARGEDALAFSHFARATELDPADTAAGLNTATVLLEAGIYDRAEKHFRAVLAVEPDSIAARLGLAAALRGQGNRDHPAPFQEAEALLREVLQQTPQDWAAVHNLAVLYSESMDRPSDATSLFSQFLSLAPAEHPARARAQKWVDEHGAAVTDANRSAAQ